MLESQEEIVNIKIAKNSIEKNFKTFQLNKEKQVLNLTRQLDEQADENAHLNKVIAQQNKDLAALRAQLIENEQIRFVF